MTIPKYLYHYYEFDNGPFRNITEHGYEKAVSIQSQISEGWNSRRTDDYIELRFALEKRLKEEFVLKGGKPNRDDPFYFTLGACEWAKSWYINPGVMKIPLSDFEPEHISFTYPDSMISFQLYDESQFATYRKEYNGQVFLLNEMEDLIRKFGLPTEEKWKTEEKMNYDRYIEVQVWDDLIVNEYKLKE